MTITTTNENARAMNTSAFKSEPKFVSHEHLTMTLCPVSIPALTPETAAWAQSLAEHPSFVTAFNLCAAADAARTDGDGFSWDNAQEAAGAKVAAVNADGFTIRVPGDDGATVYGFGHAVTTLTIVMPRRNIRRRHTLTIGPASGAADECATCNGWGILQSTLGNGDEVACPDCDETGFERGSQGYQLHMDARAEVLARVAQMRDGLPF